jgi:hypothetical protein
MARASSATMRCCARQAADDFERQRQQRVACQDGRGLAELLVAGGPAAAQVVVVERRQVVVNERVGMDELERARQVQQAGGAPPTAAAPSRQRIGRMRLPPPSTE